MDKRELSRMLRRTNTADLLDDGIENGSDLKSFAQIDEAEVVDAPKVSQVDMRTQSSPLRNLDTQETPRAVPAKEPISYLGLFFGACFVVSGVLLFLFPQDRYVFHDRLKSRSFVEHVTATGSQVYAVIALVVGIVLYGFSMYRPKK